MQFDVKFICDQIKRKRAQEATVQKSRCVISVSMGGVLNGWMNIHALYQEDQIRDLSIRLLCKLKVGARKKNIPLVFSRKSKENTIHQKV